MIDAVKNSASHAAPGGRPQPLAFADGSLWVGCWDTSRLYEIDPIAWTTRSEIELPGVPYGVASLDGALHVVVSIGEADERYIYRVVPGTPLVERERVACPEFIGSHLASDGKALYLVQQTHGRVLELGAGGSTVRTIDLPMRCAGIAFDGPTTYAISADDEFDVLELATLDLSGPTAAFATLAPVDVDARGLTFDGTRFWSSLRERNEIVSFSI